MSKSPQPVLRQSCTRVQMALVYLLSALFKVLLIFHECSPSLFPVTYNHKGDITLNEWKPFWRSPICPQLLMSGHHFGEVLRYPTHELGDPSMGAKQLFSDTSTELPSLEPRQYGLQHLRRQHRRQQVSAV